MHVAYHSEIGNPIHLDDIEFEKESEPSRRNCTDTPNAVHPPDLAPGAVSRALRKMLRGRSR